MILRTILTAMVYGDLAVSILLATLAFLGERQR